MQIQHSCIIICYIEKSNLGVIFVTHATFFHTEPPSGILVSEPHDFPITQGMESKYVDILQASTVPGATVFLHAHDFYEVLFCRDVSDVEYLVGSNRYRLQKGDIIFIAPGVPHCPILHNRGDVPYRRDGLRMSRGFLEQALTILAEETLPKLPSTSFLLRTTGTRWEQLETLFRQCLAEGEQKNPGWEAMVMANAMQLLVQLHRALSEPTADREPAEKPELLDQVLEYISLHLQEKISLGDVAREFFVSQSTISQTFRNKMGVSFYHCVTQRRLIAAKQLIDQDLSLESVSMQVGFKDYSSFYRAFKQEYGLSPRQYRSRKEKTQK